MLIGLCIQIRRSIHGGLIEVKAWDNNVGWRIDYQVVGSNYIKKINTAEIFRSERFSDHAPLIIKLR